MVHPANLKKEVKRLELPDVHKNFYPRDFEIIITVATPIDDTKFLKINFLLF